MTIYFCGLKYLLYVCQAPGTSRKDSSRTTNGKNIVQQEAKCTAHLGKKRVQAVHVRSKTNAVNRVKTRSQTQSHPNIVENRDQDFFFNNNAKHLHKKLRPNPTPVAAANTKPHFPQPPVANPVTQQQLAALTAGSGHLPSHDLLPTLSPARDNFFLEDEGGPEFGTCSNAYSCVLLYIYTLIA